MRITLKYAVWLLALMPLSQGCDEKAKTAQTQPLAPPIVDTPLPQPATVSKEDLPPPVVGTDQPKPPVADTTPKPADTPKKPVHHPKKLTPTPAAPATTPPPEETAKTTPAVPSGVSAIGQLSGGASGDMRSQTEESINATEKGVNSITRSLSDAEQKTATQIREFLKQAREALATGDTDGAHTLADKAKVLLGELNGQ